MSVSDNKFDSLVGANDDDDDDEEDDDVHVCGGCKKQFSKIEIFVSHKRECKAKKRKKAVTNSNSRVSVIVDLGKEVCSSKSVNLLVEVKHTGTLSVRPRRWAQGRRRGRRHLAPRQSTEQQSGTLQMLTCLRVFVNKLTGFEIDPEIIRYIHQGMDDLIRQSQEKVTIFLHLRIRR